MAQAFTAFAYIYLGSRKEDYRRDRVTIEAGGLRATMVGVANEPDAIKAAVELASDGAQAIDLCSAFSTAAMAGVIEAVGPTVAVGRTTYGLEAVNALARFQDPEPGE